MAGGGEASRVGFEQQTGTYQYFYQPNGSGGVDYFRALDNGTSSGTPEPITNQIYSQGTGKDTSAIEQQVYQEYALQNPGPSQPASPSQTTQTSETTSGGTSADAFKPTPYDDGTGLKLYYSAEELAQAVNRKVDSSYAEALKTIDNQFKNGFLTIDERDAEIKKTRTALIQKKGEDLQSISGYMNSISPDAIQSGRGKMEAKAVQDYTTQNTQLGSELGANLYDANGQIRQDLSANDLSPYMTQLSDTGNLARSIAGNYTNKQTAIDTAGANKNAGLTENAVNYANNTPTGSDYTNYLNSNILNKQVTGPGVNGPAIVKKTDKYGNPIDEYYA